MKNVVRILILVWVLTKASLVFAALSFENYTNTLVVPTSNVDLSFSIVPVSLEFVQLPSSNQSLQVSFPTDSTNTDVPKLVGPVLNYPNPFSYASGTRIGYRLSGEMAVELRIYTTTGYLVFSKQYAAGQEGGLGTYNRVSINMAELQGKWLAPGVYLVVLMSDGSVLGKTKMVVVP